MMQPLKILRSRDLHIPEALLHLDVAPSPSIPLMQARSPSSTSAVLLLAAGLAKQQVSARRKGSKHGLLCHIRAVACAGEET